VTKVNKKGLTTTSQTPDSVQVRDTFETPAYATKILIPFIPHYINKVWECAVGNGRIAQVLDNKYYVWGSDIRETKYTNQIVNFINDEFPIGMDERFAIITNPPYSIKNKFIEKAFEYNIPFAFLINADYSGKQIEWIERGCEKIIPNRRINYLTPNILQRIREGELWELSSWKIGYKNLDEFKKENLETWKRHLENNKHFCNYETLEDAPQQLLHKYSSSQFHSMWLTYKFDLGKTETFVDLPLEEIKENIL